MRFPGASDAISCAVCQLSQLSSAMARAALSVVFNQGRDDEVAELRRRLAQLEQDAAGESERSLARSWEALCQAGISLQVQGAQVRSLVERFIGRTRWGVAPGVQYADGTPVPPGPFNFQSNDPVSYTHLTLPTKA